MANLKSVAPELPVANLSTALEYYTGRMGFDVATVMPNRDYAVVERDAVAIHLFAAGPDTAAPVSIHVFTTGLTELHDELADRGARITQGIVEQPWGARDFRVADLAGNVMKFTEVAT